MEEFLRDMAPYQTPARARQFRNIRQSIRQKDFRDAVEKDESLNYLLRDTISLTMLGGAQQTNVIPPDAWANIDVRLLPGTDPKRSWSRCATSLPIRMSRSSRRSKSSVWRIPRQPIPNYFKRFVTWRSITFLAHL